MDDKKVYQGLCIDGGGILGVGAARALMEFEQESGKPIIEQFDYIAGTSTGAILAVLLSLGFTAEDCYRLYIEKGKDIFYQASAVKPSPSGLGCRGKKSDCLIYYIYTSIILKNI